MIEKKFYRSNDNLLFAFFIKFALQSDREMKVEDRDEERRREKKRSVTPESPGSHYRDRRRLSPASPAKSASRYRFV